MCGIAGILLFRQQPGSAEEIGAMTDAMSHRGPDSADFFTGPGIALGHRRLSIIDLSDAANQPFTDHSGRYVIVFNGEIYNYQEVRSRITGYPFRTGSDTEVLLAAYIQWGADCLRHFRGMFAFAIWDRQEEALFLARDPMGVKPLYYFRNEECLLFASEVCAILATGRVPRKVDRRALLEFFSYQSVSFPYSIIEGIGQLEAGSWLRISKDRTEKKKFWDLIKTGEGPDPSDKEGVQRHIRELMARSVERRLVSDVPVGAFLSGGIDSSAVVGLMATVGQDRPNTFTVAFDEEQYDESPYADIVVRAFNTRHNRILLRPTVMLDELTHGLDAMDSPSGDGINTYVVSKAIRRSGIKVALSGIGGDELFAGYPFFRSYLQLRSRKWLWQLPHAFKSLLAAAVPGGRGNGRRGRMVQLLLADEGTIDQLYPVFRQLHSPGLIDRLTSLEPGRSFQTSVQEILSGRREDIARLPLLSQVSVAEYLGYTQHTLLKDTDQMSMAVSLEVREPFFDQDLVEYMLTVPDLLKKPVYPKSLLVESLKPLIPDEVVFRKKQGFLFPWELWMQKELRSFCDGLIRNMAQRPFIDGQRLLAYWKDFLAGDKRIRWADIWLFVVLEYWLEKNGIDQ